MSKIKNWIGVAALALLFIQSTIGIINYTQSSSQLNFSNGMNPGNGMNMRGTPPQMNNNDSTNDTEASSESSSTSEEASTPDSMNETPQMPENRDFGRNFEDQTSSFASTVRSIINGLPGLILNILSLGSAIAWFILTILTRKQTKSVTP